MVRVRRHLKIIAVTADAGYRYSLVLKIRSVTVARFTRHCRMLAEQRETSLFMLLNHVRDLPRFARMAP